MKTLAEIIYEAIRDGQDVPRWSQLPSEHRLPYLRAAAAVATRYTIEIRSGIQKDPT